MAALTPDAQTRLAATLGVSESALADLGCGWANREALRRLHAGGAGWQDNYPDSAYVFPERNAAGRVIGLSLRASDGRKGAPSGAARGLIVPTGLKDAQGIVLCVEGASDVAACITLGLSAVGRPSNHGGADLLALLLEGRRTLVVGERDQKDGGAWPGRDGARKVAAHLAAEWDEMTEWSLPPQGIKDVRAWLLARIQAGLSVADAAACKAAGAELMAALTAAARPAKPNKVKPPSDAELIVRLASDLFRFGRTPGDEPFAVRRSGPNVAIMLRGSSDALRAGLAREFRATYSRTPCSSALTDALLTLQGFAQDIDAEPVELRVAEYEGGIVLDLGGSDGRAVVIRPGVWEVVETSPVLFRRTELTGVMPDPVRGGSLSDLRGLLNVGDDSWALALGWLVAALLPGIPHPVLMLGGIQGTGKSTAAKFLSCLFDPSSIDNHNVPRDPEAWAMAINGSWGVVVDNVSAIPVWWADALCKAVTGGGWVRRKLYTDSSLSVLSNRRVVLLTSIDAGALRGDLSDRVLIVDLERIDDGSRLYERELHKRYAELCPSILGALLDLVSNVLAEIPSVQLGAMPRMADFSRVLAAMDKVLGTDSLGLYLTQRGRIADDVVGDDPVGEAITTLIRSELTWTGTAQDLWGKITPIYLRPDGWPRSARSMAGCLRRLIPALSQVGIEVTPPTPTDKTRRYILRATAQTAQPPASGPGSSASGGQAQAVVDLQPPNGIANSPADNPTGDHGAGDFGRSGDSGGSPQHPSDGNARPRIPASNSAR